MRQTKTGAEKKEKQRCASCGITEPYHRLACPSQNFDLFTAEVEEKKLYEAEKVVPREQGARVLNAILLMISTPKKADGKPSKVFYERKTAIQAEIGKL